MAQSRTYTGHGIEIALEAVVDAHHHGYAFTVAGFCAAHGFKANRHTRAVLNQLVREGVLVGQKRLYSDGHYRKCYSRPSMRLWEKQQQLTIDAPGQQARTSVTR